MTRQGIFLGRPSSTEEIWNGNGANAALMALASAGLTLLDSTLVALGGSATYTGAAVDSSPYSRLVGIVFADRAGTLNVDQSQDGVNWDYTSPFSIAISSGLAFSVEVVAPFVRMRIVNGTVAQAILRAYLRGRVI